MKFNLLKLVFVLMALFVTQHFSAQQIEDFEDLIKTPVLPSPDAASLGKYGQIPVSLNSGTPQIDVPLYEMKSNNLGINISVSYHGSGIKVSEVASVVGLGWSINAGGVITRVVRGWPDEMGEGYFNTFSYFKSNIEGSPDFCSGMVVDSKTQWKLRFTQGYLDKEPDIFYFNFDGYSGKIIFNENREPVCFPFQNFKIQGSIDNTWTITTPDGKRYYFGKKEHTTFKFGGSFISSWHLTSITTSKSNELIQFEYQDNTSSWEEDRSTLPKSQFFSKRPILGQESFPFCTMENPEEEVQTVNSTHLKSITFPNQKLNIVFKYKNDRRDIGAEQSVQRLSDINIYHGEGLLKSYAFGNNDYFVGNDSPFDAFLNKRMRLNSIANNIDKTSYMFEYYDDYQMPSYISADTDHWGYFNDAHNSSLLPNTLPEGMSQTHYISTANLTANKETNPNSVKACALKKIIYPTGGFSQFTWESNVISYDSADELKNKSWNIYYGRNYYTPSWLESSFITHMRSIYVDDPDILSANIRMEAFNKYEESTVDIGITGLDPEMMTRGYYKVYLYKFMDFTMPEGRPLMPLPFDIMNHPDCKQISNNQSLIIRPGTYYLIILATDDRNVNYISGSVYFQKKEQVGYVDKNVGGIRIKEIEHSNGHLPENVATHQYYYKRDFLVSQHEGEPVDYKRSSGKLFMDPYYSEYKYHYKSNCSQNIVATSYLVNDRGEPYNLEGSHIGYSEVTEIISTNNGFKITKFWNEEDMVRRNLILSEHWYDNNNSETKEVFNSYVSYSSFQNPISRLDIRLVYSHWYPDYEFQIVDILFSPLSPTGTYSMWFGKSKSVEKTYTVGGTNFVRDSVLYYYDGAALGKHSFLTRKNFFNSDNADVVETYKYAQDFTLSGNFLKQMVLNHIINEPIEYVRKINSRIVTAYYKKYISNNSREIYECDFSKYPAIDSGIDANGNLSSNTYYRKRYSLNLDAWGNLFSIVKDEIFPISFIYGYNSTQPVVAIENMNYSQINSSILTAIRSHAFSESEWPNDITGDINFLQSSLGSLYNDKNYLISIYTYKPLVGITSVTDPEGITTFYEYDSPGRLHYIKDHNGKTLEQYDYHYKP